MGKNITGEKFRRGKISPGRNFAGEKFRHLPKISSLFPDEIFPDKVCIFKRVDNPKFLLGKIVQFSYLEWNKKYRQYSSSYVDLSKDSYRGIGIGGLLFVVRLKMA